jgi:flagellar hook protein FlgE
MTRAGAFTPDDQGRLVNAAGFQLMGYSYANGTPAANANGFGGLEPVDLTQNEVAATASREGVFTANLPSATEIVDAASLPSANAATAEYSAKSSIVAYDSLGGEIILDVYSTKTADNTWEVSIYNKADAAPNTSFPYASGALVTETLDFDPTSGQLTTASATDITIPVPGGEDLVLDLSKMTQLAQGYTVSTATVDGAAPSTIDTVEINPDGVVFAQYANGSIRELYRIPLADVESPDRLNVLPGNVFSQSYFSGPVSVGFPGEGGKGAVLSGALESSNVDVAEELTTMIESQRSYTANSKVFQTGADLMDILVNLKR